MAGNSLVGQCITWTYLYTLVCDDVGMYDAFFFLHMKHSRSVHSGLQEDIAGFLVIPFLKYKGWRGLDSSIYPLECE